NCGQSAVGDWESWPSEKRRDQRVEKRLERLKTHLESLIPWFESRESRVEKTTLEPGAWSWRRTGEWRRRGQIFCFVFFFPSVRVEKT
ncbi:hypothetical protein U1Q18_041338, partial [Sarracenia purpurea var. burkii]